MSDNERDNGKGNESEKKHEQDQSTDRTKPDIGSEDIFGVEKPNDRDGMLSDSGDHVLSINDSGNIYVEKRNGERIPRRRLNYIKRLEDGGPAQNVFREEASRVEICVDRWIISHKEETGNETNEVGNAEDLLPIVAEAL